MVAWAKTLLWEPQRLASDALCKIAPKQRQLSATDVLPWQDAVECDEPCMTDAATERESPDSKPPSIATVIAGHEPHNLLALSAYSVLLRFAWIFKTESVIIPAFLDSIAGAGWLRGCLPVLNRFGQSLPPIFFSQRLRAARVKKWSLLGTSAGLGVSMLIVATMWTFAPDKQAGWLPPSFLVLYLIFFAANGLNQQVFGTLQGKLIRPDRRGELLGISGVGGSILSVIAAWFLLQRWLSLPDHGFGLIFGFAGCGFLVCGLVCLAVREPADPPSDSTTGRPSGLRASIALFVHDRDFRKLGIVAMLFIAIQLLFPHFQALGRRSISAEEYGYQLMLWVVAQNVAVGLFSWFSGQLADRFGNRLSLQLLVFGTACVPLLALLLVQGVGGLGPRQLWLAFFFLGLTPVTMKMLTNYALELTRAEQHPLYVATLQACLAVPFALSPLVGWLVDRLGFEPVFIGISGVIALGGLSSLRLIEPRHHATLVQAGIVDPTAAPVPSETE